MLNLPALKAMVAGLGIRNLSIRFDASNRQIVATFTWCGKAHEKIITFAEIENAFTDTPKTNEEAPGLADRQSSG